MRVPDISMVPKDDEETKAIESQDEFSAIFNNEKVGYPLAFVWF